jgi:hypothetical protein
MTPNRDRRNRQPDNKLRQLKDTPNGRRIDETVLLCAMMARSARARARQREEKMRKAQLSGTARGVGAYSSDSGPRWSNDRRTRLLYFLRFHRRVDKFERRMAGDA